MGYARPMALSTKTWSWLEAQLAASEPPAELEQGGIGRPIQELAGALAGKSAFEQMEALHTLLETAHKTFSAEAMAQHAAMFANYPYWERGDFSKASIDEARRDHVLAQLAAVWAGEFKATAS